MRAILSLTTILVMVILGATIANRIAPKTTVIIAVPCTPEDKPDHDDANPDLTAMTEGV